MTNMNISPKGLIELANYEALSHTKYIDSGGVHTIGIGMTTSEIKDLYSWSWDKALSTQECVDMYKQSLGKYINALNKALTRPIEQHKFDALVSTTYNIGVGGMASSTFIKLVNMNASDKDVVEALKRWNKDNGKVVKGLVNRRQYESDLYTTGTYRANGQCTCITVNSSHKPVYKGTIDLTPYV